MVPEITRPAGDNPTFTFGFSGSEWWEKSSTIPVVAEMAAAALRPMTSPVLEEVAAGCASTSPRRLPPPLP
jgi:hypothetical protein